jgi:threonine synthase
VNIDGSRVESLMKLAYGDSFDTPEIAPVVGLEPGMFILELWHGPTSAFKDLALQCMPLLFAESAELKKAETGSDTGHLVLVATSGDTGTAALDGFSRCAGIRTAVFYPLEGVSATQRRQMVTRSGENILVFGVEGDFDDCQHMVKTVFNDREFGSFLLRDHSLQLSSANSINWGRLLPQIVYYFSAYARMADRGDLEAGSPVDICVPTGNFGNILAAHYARRMGLPVENLICASNENTVLTDFISSGIYDMRDRPIVKTPSPSMDIVVSSNLERFLFDICRDSSKIREWISRLDREGSFEIDRGTFDSLSAGLSAGSATNDETLAAIRRVCDMHGCLLDPHSAVAWHVAERNRSVRPMMVVSSAHWAKFSSDVYRAISDIRSADPLPREVADLSALQLCGIISEETGVTDIPSWLIELEGMEERFTGAIDRSVTEMKSVLIDWIEGGNDARAE